jgi:hypothetical protein
MDKLGIVIEIPGFGTRATGRNLGAEALAETAHAGLKEIFPASA